MKSMVEKENRSDYTVEKWLSIFETSINKSGDGYKHPLSFIAKSILGFKFDHHEVGDYLGLCFLETLCMVTDDDYNPYIKDKLKFELIYIGGIPDDEFMVNFTYMINHKLLSNKLDEPFLVEFTALDYNVVKSNLAKDIYDTLNNDGLWFRGNKINPKLTTVESYQTLFAALLIFYDRFLVKLGSKKYKKLIDRLHNVPMGEFKID